MKVLVAEAAKPASLAIVRSLGKKGMKVTALDTINFCTSFLSKYCHNPIKCPSPEEDREVYIRSLLQIVKKEKYDVLYPVSDLTTIPISAYKDKFMQYVKVPIPDYETVMKAANKVNTLKIAVEENIPCPKTYFIKDLKEVKKLTGELDYPIVIKPACKTIWVNNRAVTTKVTASNYVHSAEELIPKYKKIHNKSPFPLIQEYVPGGGYGFFALLNHSEPRAIFMHKRLREYPITGGASTLRESIYNDKLKEMGLKLLKAMNWHGVAMVEFKLDSRDNQFKLMEVNGRWWGSLPLAIASGVDFPYLLHNMTVDGDIKPIFKYKTGVKCRLLIPNDILWFMSSLLKEQNKLKTIHEFFKFGNMAYDILSWDDPLPTIGALRVAFSQAANVFTKKRSLSGELLMKEEESN